MINLISRFMLFLSLILASAAGYSAQLAVEQAPDQPLVRGFGDGKYWVTAEEMSWIIGDTSEKIVVPKGFVTDFASIPEKLSIVGLTAHGPYNRAAVIHDFLYWAQSCTKEQADRLLVIAMKESHVGILNGWAIHKGVDIGGKPAWNNNAKERERGLPKIIPSQYLKPSDPNLTWSEYRKQLVEKGVKDPVFEKNPTYCAYGDSTEVPTQPLE